MQETVIGRQEETHTTNMFLQKKSSRIFFHPDMAANFIFTVLLYLKNNVENSPTLTALLFSLLLIVFRLPSAAAGRAVAD
jgi:hypothetical protein